MHTSIHTLSCMRARMRIRTTGYTLATHACAPHEQDWQQSGQEEGRGLSREQGRILQEKQGGKVPHGEEEANQGNWICSIAEYLGRKTLRWCIFCGCLFEFMNFLQKNASQNEVSMDMDRFCIFKQVIKDGRLVFRSVIKKIISLSLSLHLQNHTSLLWLEFWGSFIVNQCWSLFIFKNFASSHLNYACGMPLCIRLQNWYTIAR